MANKSQVCLQNSSPSQQSPERSLAAASPSGALQSFINRLMMVPHPTSQPGTRKRPHGVSPHPWGWDNGLTGWRVRKHGPKRKLYLEVLVTGS